TGNVDTSGRIYSGTIPVAFEFDKLSLVLERAIGLDIEGSECRAIRDVDRLFIRTQNDSIGTEVLAVPGHHTGRTRIEEPAHCEVEAALAVGCQIIDNSADAIQGITLIFVRQHLSLRRKLPNRLVQAPLDDKHRTFRVDGD